MARTPAKATTTPKAADVLLGSDSLPATITTASGEMLHAGDLVRLAHEVSGLTVEAWNALDAVERDKLIAQVLADFAKQLADQEKSNSENASKLETMDGELKGEEISHEAGALSNFKVSRPVLIVSAPGGARRRAGLGFDVQPRELTEEELGATAEEVEARINALRADPKLKIDTRLVEIEE